MAPGDPRTRLAFMLLVAVESRAHAVMLLCCGPAGHKEPPPRRLFCAVCKNCGKLDSDECKIALLKLYYYHF